MLPGISPAGSPGVTASVPVVVTQTALKAGVSASNANIGIGTAAADRYVVVVFTTYKGGTTSIPNHSSVTVAGVSCTKVAEATDFSSSFNNVFRTTMWISSSPITSGSTATIALSYGTVSSGTIVVYTLNGISSPTPYATATGTGASPVSSSINYPANGALIAGSEMDTSSSWTATWSGATLDVATAVGGFLYSTASKASLAALSGQAISCTASTYTLSSGSTIVAATWSPA